MAALTPAQIISKKGVFAKEFPIESFDKNKIKEFDFVEKYGDLVEISDKFKAEFENAGFMIGNKVYTVKTKPIEEAPITLGQIAEKDGVDAHYFLNENQRKKYEYLRGSKKIPRVDKNGFEYMYSEGAMSPYDVLDLPARTMLTSEGTTNRSTHIIKDPKEGKLRILTPIECERKGIPRR